MNKKIVALLLCLAMCVTMLTACGEKKPSGTDATPTPATTQQADPTKAPDPTPIPTPEVMTYSESPESAALVKSGAIPKVEQRIPDVDNILVDTKDATGATLSIGTYGGVINLGSTAGSWGISRQVLESIVRYNTDGSYYPNVIKEITHNDTYTEWTFKLREGMRWSDGEVFNADDITFWYYMCHLTDFDTKKSWKALKDGDDYAVLTKVNDYEVKWTFKNEKLPSAFIEDGDFKWCWAPSHYLKDLIPDSIYVENPYWAKTGLSDDQVLINAAAKNISASSVSALGKSVSYYFWNVSGIPTLNSFVLTTKEGNNTKDSQLCILERNNYFWKVDAMGQQLPYCDAIHYNKTSAEGQDELMLRDGTIDMIETKMAKIPGILADMGDKAVLRTMSSTNWGSSQITFNYTCSDKKYADLFNNISFREAMSICVDREKISDLLSDGFLEPAQCAPSAGNLGYSEEWSKKWTSYDLAKAKNLLESCGLKMGSDGFYDFADGTDLQIVFYSYTESGADDVYTVLEQYFTAAGIKTAHKSFELTAYDQEIDNNTWYACVNPHTAIGGLSLRSRTAPFVPVAQAAEWYGDFGTYYQTNGASGVKPSGDMAKLVELYEKWVKTYDTTEKDKINLEIYKIHQENLWSIAYLEAAGTYSIVSTKIKNYPDNLVSDDLYQYSNIIHFWTLYKEQ